MGRQAERKSTKNVKTKKGVQTMTQKELVLKYIHDFEYITSFQAYADLGITQLGARIKELKELGYQFKTENVKTTNRYGKPSHYYKYYLIERVS